jgi:DNA-binding NarL/FixJ family response regulator
MAEYTTRFEDGIPVISYTGTITSLVSPPMPGINQLILDGYKKIIIDASKITYINSQGLSSIISTHRFCYKNNVQMKADVIKVIRVARADLFIPVFDDLESALKELKQTSGKTLSREKIIVVQRNLQLADDLRQTLSAAHQDQYYEIEPFMELAKASDEIKEHGAELVIVEVNLDSSEVEHFVNGLALNAETRIIPILVASPKSKYEAGFDFILNGVDDYLPHPFDEWETPTRLRLLLELYYLVKATGKEKTKTGLQLSRSVRDASSVNSGSNERKFGRNQ